MLGYVTFAQDGQYDIREYRIGFRNHAMSKEEAQSAMFKILQEVCRRGKLFEDEGARKGEGVETRRERRYTRRRHITDRQTRRESLQLTPCHRRGRRSTDTMTR